MILTVHQPAYFPWLGYFNKLNNSDLFVYLDSVQFEKRGFIHRNKIKTPTGFMWLTIPVKTKLHREKQIKDIEIDYSENWIDKHLKAIYLNYKKAKYFDFLYPKLELLYKKQYKYLSDLCFDHLVFWMNELKIKKKIVRSSQLPVSGKKSELILNLCLYFNSDVYISGKLGKNYLEEDVFKQNQIKIIYQDYKHPVYPQLWGEFVPNLSVLDLVMNHNDYSFLNRVYLNNRG